MQSMIAMETTSNAYLQSKLTVRRADEILTFASGLEQPNGLAIKDGDLYVAEISRLWRYKNIEAFLNVPTSWIVTRNESGVLHKTVTLELPPELLYDKFPTEVHHGWKYLAFGPDGLLYVPVGKSIGHRIENDI
jgi:glucose/arabinose dehydrogenase